MIKNKKKSDPIFSGSLFFAASLRSECDYFTTTTFFVTWPFSVLMRNM